jgi:mono/diheme cytochrome c family protein
MQTPNSTAAKTRVAVLALLVVNGLFVTTLIAGDVHPERDYAAIIRKNCLRCHVGKDAKAGLDLSTRDSLLRGGDSGPAIAPAQPDESLLLQRAMEGSMPPINDGPQLSVEDIELLREWIQAGARWGGERLELQSIPSPRPTPQASACRGRIRWFRLRKCNGP